MVPGPCQVRPWNLGFRPDFGFSGYCEQEEAEFLLQLIFTEGFGTQVFRVLMQRLYYIYVTYAHCLDQSFQIVSQCFCYEVEPRFRSNAEALPGVERIAVMEPDRTMLETNYDPCPPLHPGG